MLFNLRQLVELQNPDLRQKRIESAPVSYLYYYCLVYNLDVIGQMKIDRQHRVGLNLGIDYKKDLLTRVILKSVSLFNLNSSRKLIDPKDYFSKLGMAISLFHLEIGVLRVMIKDDSIPIRSDLVICKNNSKEISAIIACYLFSGMDDQSIKDLENDYSRERPTRKSLNKFKNDLSKRYTRKDFEDSVYEEKLEDYNRGKIDLSKFTVKELRRFAYQIGIGQRIPSTARKAIIIELIKTFLENPDSKKEIPKKKEDKFSSMRLTELKEFCKLNLIWTKKTRKADIIEEIKEILKDRPDPKPIVLNERQRSNPNSWVITMLIKAKRIGPDVLRTFIEKRTKAYLLIYIEGKSSLDKSYSCKNKKCELVSAVYDYVLSHDESFI